MKIVAVDNYGRESVADFLVCENVANDYVGKLICDLLNEHQGASGDRFYKTVQDDYRLWRGMEELV